MKTKLLTAALAILLQALLCSAILTACNRGSEVENEFTGGRIFMADGKPASKASVKFYAVNAIPGNGPDVDRAFSTKTDAQGRYQADSLPKGEYNILASLNGDVAFEDSISIASPATRLPSDTLGDPASFSGIVGLETSDDPRTAIVQVLGTNTYSNVDRNGRFTLSNLGAGRYSVRVVTTLPNYTPLYTGFTIEAGQAKQAADTLRLAFTGIPAVRGLKIAYDTLQGIVTLSWNKADYSNISDYLIYRDDAAAVSPTFAPVGRVQDTVFRDSLFKTGSTLDFIKYPWNDRELVYRVNIRSKNLATGPFYESVTFAVTPLSLVQTTLSIQVENARNDSASVHDTVKIILDFLNPTRKIQTLKWYLDGSAIPIHDIAPAAWAGRDAIFLSRGTACKVSFRIEAADNGDTIWKKEGEVTFIRDEPVADAGADTLVFAESKFLLHASAANLFGKIVKWEWDIGAAGKFVEVKSGDTLISVSNHLGTMEKHALRVTDDDGFSDTDTLSISTIAYLSKAPRPKLIGSATSTINGISANGKIWLMETRTGLYSNFNFLSEYDLATDQWKSKSQPIGNGPMVILDGMIQVFNGGGFDAFDTLTGLAKGGKGSGFLQETASIGEIKGKLFVVGGFDGTYSLTQTNAYDQIEDKWTTKSSIPYDNLIREGLNFRVAFTNDHIYAFPTNGNAVNYVYDPDTDKWSPFKRLGYGDNEEPLAVLDGKIYCMNHNTHVMDVYDIKTGGWAIFEQSSFYIERNATLKDYTSYQVFNGRIYAFFMTEANQRIHVQVFDPIAAAYWKPLTYIQTSGNRFKSFLAGGKVYLVAYQATVENSAAGKTTLCCVEPPSMYEFLLPP